LSIEVKRLLIKREERRVDVLAAQAVKQLEAATGKLSRPQPETERQVSISPTFYAQLFPAIVTHRFLYFTIRFILLCYKKFGAMGLKISDQQQENVTKKGEEGPERAKKVSRII
jgi:hypothetical protein